MKQTRKKMLAGWSYTNVYVRICTHFKINAETLSCIETKPTIMIIIFSNLHDFSLEIPFASNNPERDFYYSRPFNIWYSTNCPTSQLKFVRILYIISIPLTYSCIWESISIINKQSTSSGNFNPFYYIYVCDALRNLVSFVQSKKREKHP